MQREMGRIRCRRRRMRRRGKGGGGEMCRYEHAD
jgi:hypothetical protein